ncbi:PEP-CTERM system TPR-repeat protein PrsT [Massilia sp. IC2-477]|uniref:XrtA/PEP-CTERM system TPR-repeat protein PrsT n=1 Tax=Massilia sp. IC2-477 TaxID=2887198 RepID=UPI001D123F7C|nr:XrtA/PEP-CTERM system TPR-repeat protein PrsT [Massilia sp. IC2-477]MCC2955077.1 PEP-CTERM system TPR-repeat protein PrsT [Massilia sp. IC2-477]
MPGTLSKKQLAVAVVSGAILLSAGMVGCSRTQTTEELLTEAQNYVQKGDRKAALIQLKNAVAQSPENVEARLRLGNLSLETGDMASAEKEFRKAASLGAAPEKTLPQLARILFFQGKYKDILDEVTPEKAKGSAELLARRGDAHLGLGERDKAKEAYDAALAVNPNSGDALIGMARLAVMNNDLQTTERLVDEATTRDARNAEAWMMKGNLLRSTGKSKEALAAYDKVLEINPVHRSAYVEKAYVHIGTNDLAAAKADLDAARKEIGSDLNITYAQALLDYTGGKNAEAKDSLQKILKVAPEHMPSILLSGAVELNLGGNQLAEQHLRKYLESNSNNVYARKLLAQVLLKSNQPTEAAAVLSPALKEGGQDAQLLALTGQSYLQSRDFAKASAYLEQASALAPGAASIRTSLGLSKLGQGDWDKAIGELERAATLDPKSTDAGVALVQAELRRGQYDKALAAVQALEKAQPDNPLVHNMKGGVYLGKQDMKSARAAFEKAVALNPTYFPAVSNLARLDIAENNPAGARKRFEAMLVKDKKNIDALSALAAMELQQGRSAEAGTWLEKAQSENPQAIAPAVNLGAHYLRNKQADKALALARKMLAVEPSNPELLDLLGQAQIATKDYPAALETFSKLAAATPKSPAAQMRLAAVNMLMKNDTAASDNLKRALSLEPKFMQARVAQVELAMRNNKPEEALAVARQVQKDEPKAALGFQLEGDLLLAQQKLAPALAAYEKAYALSKAPADLIKISEMLKRSGKEGEAQARLVKYHAANPKDQIVGLVVADSYLAKREYKQAIASLESVLKANPSNAAALNNLAYAYQQEKDARALPTAEQAYKLAGQNPAIMDTLGWILVEKGDTARGVDLLRKAVAAVPDAPDLRYHLAAGLAKAGDKAGARKELEKTLASGKPFASMDDAKTLMRQL